MSEEHRPENNTEQNATTVCIVDNGDIATCASKQNDALFEELCALLRGGMDEDDALEWQTSRGLVIAREQADYLEREHLVFDGEDFLNNNHAAAKPTPTPIPEKPVVQPRTLSKVDKRNGIMGMILIALLIAAFVVNFIIVK